MKRALSALIGLFLASSAAAQAPSPAQMGITPSTTPEVLQVLDRTKAWSTLGTIDPTTHIFTPVGGAGPGPAINEVDVVVTDPSIGMVSGGTDNTPFINNLMTHLSPTVVGNYDVTFPAQPGQSRTTYYFHNSSFINRRAANYHCSGSTPYPSVFLLFDPGYDGFVQENKLFTSDGADGGGTLNGCQVYTLGMGQVTASPSAPNSLTNVAFNPVPDNIVPLPTWTVGDGILLSPHTVRAYPSSAVITAPIGTTVTACAPSCAAATSLTISGTGITNTLGVTPLATAVFTQTGTNNFAVNDTLQVGPNTYKFLAAIINSSPAYSVLLGPDFATSAANLVAAINGTAGQFKTYAPPTTGEGGYGFDPAISAAYASGVITFSSRFGGTDTNSFPSVYTATGTAAGAFGGATFSGAVPTTGVNNLRFWQFPAAQAVKVQTTTGSATATVVGGARLIRTADIVFSDAFPFGTMVTSATGTAGAQTLQMRNPANNAAQLATVTHAAGAEGNLWVMYAGLKRRTLGHTSNNTFNSWPIGIQMNCSSGQSLNCDGSYDTANTYQNDFVGRWNSGDNYSSAGSINELYANNFLADLLELGQLGMVYLNPNFNAQESGSKYAIIKNCANQNQAIVFGSYYGGGGNGCANQTSVYPPTYGGVTMLGALNPNGFQHGANSLVGPTYYGTYFFSGGNDQAQTICMNGLPGNWYTFGVSNANVTCAASNILGLSWQNLLSAWEWRETSSAINERFVSSTLGYTGYAGPALTNGAGVTMEFPNGALFGGDGNSNALTNARYFGMGETKPSSAAHFQGNLSVNTVALPGAAAGWYYAPTFSTTLTAPVTTASTTVTVTGCPPTALPTTTMISDVTPALDVNLGFQASCTAGVLTFNGAHAVGAGASGDTIKFLEWRPVMPIPNDAAGTSWPVGTPSLIASLAPCSGATTVGYGTVTNGQTIGTAGYGAAVGTTGSSTRAVFCDGAGWTYH